MKKMRIPLLVVLALAIIGIIFGSIFDLQLSQAIASSTNGFGLTISVIGPTIGFCAMAILGGAFIAFALHGNYNKYLKIFFWIIAAVAFGVGIYYGGKEYFGTNGFNNKSLKWIGYLIVILPLAGSEYLGYRLFKDNENKNMWIILLIGIAAFALALVGFVNILKMIMHRPRFRTVVSTDVEFHNWWQRCANYKDLMKTFNLASEEFKSYPSGHTTEACMVFIPVIFLPLSNKKYEKYQLKAFICAALFVGLVALARILAAAHYLSDVSTGATITTLLIFCANEIVIRNKKLQLDVTEVEEDA